MKLSHERKALISKALHFYVWAAGEGLFFDGNEPDLVLLDYANATGEDDYGQDGNAFEARILAALEDGK